MNQYYVDNLEYKKSMFFLIRLKDDMSILPMQTKYLKHKTNSRCSPNTVKRIAYALTHYMNYMEETQMRIEGVFKLHYDKQYEHFINFLYWLKAGNHCSRNKLPSNNTCNDYLKLVFGFYEFLILQYEHFGDLKISECSEVGYNSGVGVRFTKSIKVFKGYLQKEEHQGRTIEKDKIITLIEACTNIRNRLLLLMLADTGFRIGEILGIRYAQDIDFENRSVRVCFREDNENNARAKNAEYRPAKLSIGTFEILQYYISENRKLLKDTNYLFVNFEGQTRGKAMTVNGVYSVLRILEKKTNIKVTPHMLRHYFANERHKAGWDILLISKALGHKHIKTTQQYLNIDGEKLLSVTDEFYENNKSLYLIDQLL